MNRVRDKAMGVHSTEDVYHWPLFAGGSIWTESVLDIMTMQVSEMQRDTRYEHCRSKSFLAVRSASRVLSGLLTDCTA